MTRDLEAITKAAQAAALLCADLREVFQSANPLLSEVIVVEIELAAGLQRRLERLQEAVERMDNVNTMPKVGAGETANPIQSGIDRTTSGAIGQP